LPWGLHYHAQGPVLAGQAHQEGPVSLGWSTCASPSSVLAFIGSAGGKNFGKECYTVAKVWDTFIMNKPC
jgi:hypothetical protein